jgi:hypothetical protein
MKPRWKPAPRQGLPGVAPRQGLPGVAGLLAFVALCALPAQGDPLMQGLSPAEIHALTPIDSVPTREALDDVLQAPDLPQRIVRLEEIALAASVDFGVKLRAIRALPHYCSASCRSDGVGTGDPAHLAIRKIFTTLDPMDHSGPAVLRLRATLEALGATRSGLDDDVALLVPFLGYGSRDIRVTAARALRDLCNVGADTPLRLQLQREHVEQVRLAISAALDDLAQCGPPMLPSALN